MEVERHPHELAAEAVGIGRIEVEIGVAIAAAAAVRDHLVTCQIVLRHRLLPLGPHRGVPSVSSSLDRSAVGLHRTQIASTDKAMRPVIEIVAVEFVDAHPDRTRRDEGIEYLVVEEPSRWTY